MTKIKSNKRSDLRFSVHDGKAILESSGGIFALLKGNAKALPIVNISSTGLRLLSKKKLNIGDKISFSVNIPLLGAKPLKLSGEVVWVKTFAIFDEYMVGIKFSGIRMNIKNRLNNLTAFLGTRTDFNRKIVFKEFKKKPNACVVCQFAHTEPTNVLKITR